MQLDIILIYFIYGLAFFSMGVALALEAGRSPLVAEARALIPLSVFGFLHGIYEWLELALFYSGWLTHPLPEWIEWLRLGILTLSFTSLAAFGLLMMEPQLRLTRREIVISGIFFLTYLLLVILIGISSWHIPTDRFRHLDAALRYLLAVPAAALAAWALNHRAVQAKQQGLRKLSLSLRLAAWSFAFYALTQAVVPPLDIFPGNLVNTAVFLERTGFPIQIVRAILAISITVNLVRAIQAAEAERQRQFLVTNQARLEALEQLHQELVKREALRQQLLRHTVIAQEEERGRIARELHDETAQVLTAFSLHLATLRDQPGNGVSLRQQVAHLQSLSNKMSQGIYRLVHDLRPAQLDDLGLVAALQYLVDEFRQQVGLDVQLDIRGQSERLNRLVETVAFRIAQEALTNIVRHSKAKEATVRLHFFPEQLTLQVQDQGIGFDPQKRLIPPSGWGLEGMRERAESLGGQLNLESSPGKGTLVEVLIPLDLTVQEISSWKTSASS